MAEFGLKRIFAKDVACKSARGFKSLSHRMKLRIGNKDSLNKENENKKGTSYFTPITKELLEEYRKQFSLPDSMSDDDVLDFIERQTDLSKITTDFVKSMQDIKDIMKKLAENFEKYVKDNAEKKVPEEILLLKDELSKFQEKLDKLKLH